MFGLEMKELLMYGGGALLGLVVLIILLKGMFGGGKSVGPDVEKSRREFLDEYPPPPPAPPNPRLLIDGIPVRLRLVVVAPAGMQRSRLSADSIPEMLDDVLRGLGAFASRDKPRLRVWPAQLSVNGFAPTFFRLVESPDDEGHKSDWVRVAGPIKIAGETYLLGIAVLAEAPNKLGSLHVEAHQWREYLHIDK